MIRELSTAKRRTSTIACGVVATALLYLMTGCSGALKGDWHMVEAIPNKDVFCLDDANFARDGSFSVTSTIDGKTIREVGTYKFNGFKLTLHPQAGGQRQYGAVLKFRTLEITDGDRKVILKKGK